MTQQTKSGKVVTELTRDIPVFREADVPLFVFFFFKKPFILKARFILGASATAIINQ
jgi:hypothetical protein